MQTAERHTKQRTIIYDTVTSSCDHPSAETVFKRVREVLPDVSLGTVYRNLALLSEEGKILRIRVDGGDRFDKTVIAHAHLHCERCNAVVDVGNTSLNEFAQRLGNESGCTVTGCNVLLEGYCANCNK